jgi:sulfoxide reductase heme-binding subunit YedZ
VTPAERRGLVHAAVVALASVPFVSLIAGALGDGLGANPIERVTHVTGEWTLRFLLLALAVTPFRRLARVTWIAPYRRTFGLLAFGYGTLHGLTYVVLDQQLDLALLLEDVLERRYVTAGFAAWLCMLPLAATSTRAMVRRLGLRWKALHRLAYLAGLLGVIHYLWLVKADLLAPLLHAAVLVALLFARLPHRPTVKPSA